MARIAFDQSATGSVAIITATGSGYDSTKWSLGTLIEQTLGSTPANNYIGPLPIGQARPFEESVPLQYIYTDSFSWSPRYDWVFLLESLATAVSARRVSMYVYDRTTQLYNWNGYITTNLCNTSAHTLRGFRMMYHTYNTGSASVAVNAVTGTNTLFQTQRIGAGSRIGFGTSDPTQVSSWYNISTITNDTAIVLATSAGSIASTNYVIEELRPLIVSSNATVTNGGLFLTKGVNYNDFTPSGTIIASASTVDNLKACYWLADAPVVTNTTACGVATINYNPSLNSNFTQSAYIIDSTTTKVYKYNLRTVGTGSVNQGRITCTGSDIIITGAQAFTGTVAQTNNGTLVTAGHGAGSGTPSLYFATTTRLCRVAVSSVTNANVTWQSDLRAEIPPGGIGVNLPLTNLLSFVDYDNVSDKFLVVTTGASAIKSYWTQYPGSGVAFDYSIYNDYKIFDGSTSQAVPIPYNTLSTAMTSNIVNGVLHVLRFGTAAVGQHALFAIPVGAHWAYTATTNQVAISPVITPVNINKYYRIDVYHASSLGTDPWITPVNAHRVFYRTSGISDNSGSWTLIDNTGDLSSVSATTQIQFKFEFEMLGNCTGIPARINGFTLIYDDLSNDSHYQPSVNFSSTTAKQFAWRFSTAFSSAVPTLRIRLYDAVTGGLLVDDNSAAPTGTWEKSTDAVSFVPWTNADKGNETTYLRFTPVSLADSIKVRALLTLN